MSPIEKIAPHKKLSLGSSRVQKIQEIISYFPVGERMDYYPEYKANLTMQSIILGYEINGHVIFVRDQVKFLTGKNNEMLITVYISGEEYEYTQVTSFCIILPGKAGEEYKLNYLNKASLGTRGQFRAGNAITMMMHYQQRGVIQLEGTVRESILPKSGCYRNHQLVLLEVIATSLEINEQRTHDRIKTKRPIKISLQDNTQTHSCLMIDYSEVGAQISFNQDDPLACELKSGDRFELSLQLDELHKTFVLGGVIMRKQGARAVLSFQDVVSDGDRRSFELIDALYIKSCLLQYPQLA